MVGMPRAIWTGAISFGLVNIPVKLYPAVSRKTVHFTKLDTRSVARIRMTRVSAADGSDVPNDALAKGYELADGRYVIVTDRSCRPSTPRLRTRSTSSSSAPSPTSTRSSTTPPTTSGPTRRR
jgi:DNA end-binding protein Ku